MDLGATICTPRSPNCRICPWTDHCAGRALGIAESLPRKAPKAKVPTRRGIAFWVERDDGHILLRQRPQKGLLGGMMEIPSTPWEAKLPRDIAAPFIADWNKLKAPVEHTFTHFHLQLNVWKTADGGTSHCPPATATAGCTRTNSPTKPCRPSCARLSLQHWMCTSRLRKAG